MARHAPRVSAIPRLMLGGRDWTLAALLLAGVAISLLVMKASGGAHPFPEDIVRAFPMVEWVNQSEKWLQEHFRWFTRGISEAVGWALESLELFLLLQPWPVLVIVLVLPALAYGGLRLGLFTFFGVMFWGAVDMWDVAISTLSLMGVSVLLCVATGTVLGIVCSQNDRFEAMLRPVLDAMQVMPAFVYLVPAIFFFGLGGPSAAMAIIIYALPPMIRLTNLGIRQVSPQMIEAARAFGATPMQMLTKVQIPQAMPSIRLGVNQTIMMALALAVLATFIGAEGLGAEVWRAITRLKVGHSFEGGLCIVIMAVIFDRMSAAMNRDRARALPAGFLEFRLLPQKWDSHPAARVVEIGIDRAWNAVGGACTATARGVGRLLGALAALVDRSMQIRISAWCACRGFLVTGLILIAARARDRCPSPAYRRLSAGVGNLHPRTHRQGGRGSHRLSPFHRGHPVDSRRRLPLPACAARPLPSSSCRGSTWRASWGSSSGVP